MSLFRTFIFLALVILSTFALTQGCQSMSPPAEGESRDLTDTDKQAVSPTFDSVDSPAQSVATAQVGVDVSQNNAQQINISFGACHVATTEISNESPFLPANLFTL